MTLFIFFLLVSFLMSVEWLDHEKKKKKKKDAQCTYTTLVGFFLLMILFFGFWSLALFRSLVTYREGVEEEKSEEKNQLGPFCSFHFFFFTLRTLISRKLILLSDEEKERNKKRRCTFGYICHYWIENSYVCWLKLHFDVKKCMKNCNQIATGMKLSLVNVDSSWRLSWLRRRKREKKDKY